MLHKVFSVMENNRIQRLIKIQSALIDFICDPDNPLDDIEQAELQQKVTQVCPDRAVAAWINRKNSKIRSLIKPVVEYLVENPNARSHLEATFRNDFSFHEHNGDNTFLFNFSKLDDDLKKLLKTMMIFMYDNLVNDGYSDSLMQDGTAFTRGDFILIWEEQNSSLNVCPACDGKAPDRQGGERKSDLDHYLPKSKYPLLALHPHNLVPICIECNQRIKMEKNPIEHDNMELLTNSFLPYGLIAAIDLINVSCKRDSAGAMYIVITAKDNAYTIPVISLNSIFALEERWSGRIDEVKKEFVELLCEVSHGFQHLKQHEAINSEEYLKSMLESIVGRVDFGSRPNRVIYQSFIRFSLVDNIEFSELDAMLNP